MTTKPAVRNGKNPRHVGATAIFVGHGRLPQSIGLIGSSTVVSVEIEVDLDTHKIVHVDSSGLLPRAGALLQELLQDGDLDGRIDTVLENLQRRYVGPCQRAMCSAVANAYEAYLRYGRQATMAPAISA